LAGPLSPQEWQVYKSGTTVSFPRKRYRIKGYADDQFFLDPTPDAADTMAFEYITGTTIKPTSWAASTSFAASSYCFNDGNIYQTTAGGTTGSTAPTHTSGSSSDGGVSWTFVTGSGAATGGTAYNRFLADTDVPLLNGDIVNLGMQWRWLRLKRLQYVDIKADYDAMVFRETSSFKSAPTLDMARKQARLFLSPANVADTGFG
jgi:hypothetical protein